MEFIADLHIHSKYSRATAKNLDLENLYIESQKKGIQVLGTGDSTHPGWFAELKEKLEPAEDGLFKLKDDIARTLDKEIPASCKGIVRFILESEISNIYKKNDKTRKNHNLVYFPDFDSAERFNRKLDAIGNIKSDGRPILGLDARNLLEILLDTDETGFLIPAHIWTPWFSLLGSKSGFDSLEECFDDLSGEIFAVETGLSSDPPMNWRVSSLDGLTLVSNSDAHSPSKLGREANLFNTVLSFSGIRNALKTGNPEKFLGTFEFYPEEGKYHMDGHRKCGISLLPEQSSRMNGICPECGKPMTLGVLYRVNELADRQNGEKPKIHHPFVNIIPLEEIIAELLGVGPKSMKVRQNLHRLIQTTGPEFAILKTIPIDSLKKTGIPLLPEAIQKMRQNDIHVMPGYDGEFGKIRLFDDAEKMELSGQKLLFPFKAASDARTGYIKAGMEKQQTIHKNSRTKKSEKPKEREKSHELNSLQLEAIRDDHDALLIKAGPGTGKTLTLTRKIAWLIEEQRVPEDDILAITFTRKAAGEMAERLQRILKKKHIPLTATFHSLCHELLIDEMAAFDLTFSVIDDDEKQRLIAEIVKTCENPAFKPKVVSEMIALAKQQIKGPSDDLKDIALKYGQDETIIKKMYAAYQDALESRGWLDYDDLILKIVVMLETDAGFLEKTCKRFRYIFVDEYQDLNNGQYRIVKALSASGNKLCVIGDPNQAIYGFRGADPTYFEAFPDDFPTARVIHLERNYRSTETILKASHHVITAGRKETDLNRVYSGIEGLPVIHITRHRTALSEAVSIGKRIEQMVGGTGFHSIDFGKTDDRVDKDALSFSDFAILVRTLSEGKAIGDMLEKGGIPCHIASREQAFSEDGVKRILAYLRIIHLKCMVSDIEIVFGEDKEKTKEFLNVCHPFSVDHLNRLLSENSQDSFQKPKPRWIKDWILTLNYLRKNLFDQSVKNRILYLSKEMADVKKAVSRTKKGKEALHHLLRMAEPFGKHALEFLNTIAMYQDSDYVLPHVEKVSIMTMHAAKGLEFPVVFIPGCEDGNIPYQRPGERTTDDAEERRLFYVALTRARDQLLLSYADKRTVFGKTLKRDISPFIKDIEEGLLKKETSHPDREPPLKKPIQLTLF
ncbi:MAG: UvrD-helicase domain-containing protein [Proteobacteria bacterium]|nr:UvrD-helicase domain-containing protein [Pseudomonadota bacterium]